MILKRVAVFGVHLAMTAYLILVLMLGLMVASIWWPVMHIVQTFSWAAITLGTAGALLTLGAAMVHGYHASYGK